MHLFSNNQDTAWLDKVDKRYAWIKRHLIKFEESLGHIFPQDWEVSEMIVVDFCKVTSNYHIVFTSSLQSKKFHSDNEK